ncbi:MAG TPA: helix-hairpin-helix domain-containing protein [Candidatus Polarisedimenticolia bacterium]|nr:helix-hairpin-helix domain-containing protein [Candidatus Polarisedimenticolia bacterium]
MRHRLTVRWLAAAGLAMAAVTFSFARQRALDGPEVSSAAQAFLRKVELSTEAALGQMAGIKPEVAARILQHRKSGAKFANLMEFRKVSGITNADLEAALKPFLEEEAVRQFEAQRKPIPDAPPQAGGKAAGRRERGKAGASGAEAPEQGAPGPVGAVRAGYYAKLPGYENLDSIDPARKKAFLETINSTMCTCGCQGETLAFCLVNDSSCPVVKARVKKIYDEIIAQPAP